MVVRSLVAVLLLVLSPLQYGCAAGRRGVPREAFDYTLEIRDVPEERLFALTLRSHAPRGFCISAESWPSRHGLVPHGSTRVKLLYAGGVLYGHGGIEEYCPGGCRVVVPAHGVLHAEIKYEVFGEERRILALEERKLVVDLTPFRCPR